jgi:hypothetical protein
VVEQKSPIALTQGLDLGPGGAELLHETPLCGNGLDRLGCWP